MPCKECEKLGDLCLECASHEANWRRAENAALKERAEKAEQARDAAIRELGEYARQRGLADHERDEAVMAERGRWSDAMKFLQEMDSYYQSVLSKHGATACGAGCEMGAAGPGKDGEHDPDCIFLKAHQTLEAIRAGEEKGNV